MSELTLYEISTDLVALLDTVDLCETPEKRAECEAEIDRTMKLQLKKVDDFNRYLTHLENQAALCDKEADRIKTLQRVLERYVERLEAYAVHVMEELNVKKLEGDTSQLRLRHNAPAVEITNEEQVPDKFKIIVPHVSLDRQAIKKALNAGEEVPGADLRFGRVTLLRK